MFSKDKQPADQKKHARFLAEVAQASKGSMTKDAVESLLGATPAGRTNREVREGIYFMVRSFPKAEL